jgi:hypothetical protein
MGADSILRMQEASDFKTSDQPSATTPIGMAFVRWEGLKADC